jgi:predicted RNase H-related nuclease YkuK (DUF458 family)
MGLFDKNFRAFDEWEWRHYTNDTVITIKDFISKYPQAEFYIGTDSQKHSTKRKKGQKHWKFTTCLVAYTRRRGGNAILSSEIVEVPEHLRGRLTREQRLPVLRQRLLNEASRSLQVAWYLNDIVRGDQIITIHLDVNQNLRWDSAKYKDELVGYVTAQGFNCEHKPNAWAASWAADNKC